MNPRVNAKWKGTVPEAEETRRTMLAIVLAAGFSLRALNDLRVSAPGGLDAARLCLDMLEADRAVRDSATAIAAPLRTTSAASRATGIPRETARRLLAGLADANWIVAVGNAGHQITGLGRKAFAHCRGSAILTDFIWTVSEVHAALHTTPAELDAMLGRLPWHVALATRREIFNASIMPSEMHTIAMMVRGLPHAVRDQGAAIANCYLCQHLTGLWRTFGGDLLLPLLIGRLVIAVSACLRIRLRVTNGLRATRISIRRTRKASLANLPNLPMRR